MRLDGILKTWHDDRGFGFIAPTQGGQEIFVHISAFPRDSSRPKLEEPLSFEIELNHQGKKRACNVRRPPRATSAASRRSVIKPSEKKGNFLSNVVAFALIIALGAYGYKTYSRHVVSMNQDQDSVEHMPAQRALDARCDGRTYCSQMTSCAEAKFFLKNCPGVQMDGDNDGVPCEQQWCTSPFGN